MKLDSSDSNEIFRRIDGGKAFSGQRLMKILSYN